MWPHVVVDDDANDIFLPRFRLAPLRRSRRRRTRRRTRVLRRRYSDATTNQTVVRIIGTIIAVVIAFFLSRTRFYAAVIGAIFRRLAPNAFVADFDVVTGAGSFGIDVVAVVIVIDGVFSLFRETRSKVGSEGKRSRPSFRTGGT